MYKVLNINIVETSNQIHVITVYSTHRETVLFMLNGYHYLIIVKYKSMEVTHPA